ncbi:hypothetical protein KOR42_55060 [Thalassoglobus neptunius]|uniref:Uncharacterized protein n=1 Tax=Thalassoglobus neptunius TaxID=1938619 RepID=A0A5C5UV95_9PLAN|nr:hypothetical protein [Thalassoglobus neptunius]TWT29739.1 hypothetical protein KOR42_55060 [Thalassoglobus neptunius]
MAFLLVKSERAVIEAVLNNNPHVNIAGDWHSEKVSFLKEISRKRGWSEDNVVIQSYKNDLMYQGPANLIQITLSSGDILKGKLQGLGFQVSSKSLDGPTVENDLFVKQLVSAIRNVSPNAEVRIG